MNCFICQEKVTPLNKALLFCPCEGTEIGAVHDSCAEKWEHTSGFRCALRCGVPNPPMHFLIKIFSTYFLGSSLLVYCMAQNEIHSLCSIVHLVAVCYLWLT
jgi:hypothetical protein